MKNLFTLLFALTMLATNANGQATRLVLVEEFTQASCGPCASQNPAFNTLLSANLAKVVSVKYQTWWPGYDPMYEQNQDDVKFGVPYYGVNGVPNAFIDGVVVPNDCGAYEGAPSCATQDKLDAAQAITSPIELTLTHSISADLKKITFTLGMKNVSAADFGGTGNFIRIAMVEDVINFPTAPGSNGELDFYSVMRKMIPDASGIEMPIALPAGQSFSQSFTEDLPTYFYNFNQVAMVAWVQDDASQAVHQAAYSAPVLLTGYPDLSWERTTTGPASYCDYSLTPGITITNNDALVVTDFKVDAVLNGSVVETKSYAGSLAQGASAAIAFTAVTLPTGGNYTIDYQVHDINGGAVADYNSLNNLPAPQTFAVINQTAFDTKIVEGMEDVTAGALPTPTILEGIADHDMQVVDLDYFSGLQTPPTKPVGAFLLSDKSLWVNLWDMPAGNEASLIWDKIDLTNAVDPKIKFDRSYRQYAAENDRLKVELSKDCGASWTTAFNKAGSALKTGTAITSFFVPQTAALWKSDSVIIPAAFVGEPEVLVKFHVISNFGNNLYIDNINVASGIVATNDPVLSQATSIYPNPVTDQLNIELNLPEAIDLTVNLTDVAGRTIVRLADAQAFPAGKSTLNFGAFQSSGVYFVNILSENGQTTKRFTVLK